MTTEDSEPEPDIAVIRGSIRDFVEHHPSAQETGLVVEVADSSVARDRFKCRIYGRARFPEYWIFNLGEQRLEVYRDPTGPGLEPGYQRRDFYTPEVSVAIRLFGVYLGVISVQDLFP